MKQQKHLFLIDGSGYIFRAYHALPALKRKSDGLPIGAVAGFSNMIWKLLCELRATDIENAPTHLAVIFDYSSNTFRKKIYPDYKAHRKEPPEDLIPQFSLIRQATRAFDLPCIEMEGYEADDLIATYALKATEKNFKTTIVSSDKDLMQLVNEKVFLYDSVKDKRIGKEDVQEKWGVPPELMQDLQALTGDSSDNIPGVAGIGPKTAAKLLHEFGSLDNLLQNLDKIPQDKRRFALINAQENIAIARKLVKLKTDIVVEEDIENFALKTPNGAKLIAFLKAMEFNRLMYKVAEKTKVNPIDIAAHKDFLAKPFYIDKEEKKVQQNTEKKEGLSQERERLKKKYAQKEAEQKYIILRDIETCKKWFAKAKTQKAIAYNFVFSSSDKKTRQEKCLGLSLALDFSTRLYIPFEEEKNPKKQGLLQDSFSFSGESYELPQQETKNEEKVTFEEIAPFIKDLFSFEALLKIGYNVKEDWLFLRQKFSLEKTDSPFILHAFDDVLLMAYCLTMGKISHNLEDIIMYFLGKNLISLKEFSKTDKRLKKPEDWRPEETAGFYTERTGYLFALWEILKISLAEEQLTYVYQNLEKSLIFVLVAMEEEGILLDIKTLSTLSQEFDAKAQILQKEIYTLAGEEFNIASPKQLGDILFKKLQYAGGRKTKTGQLSTSVQFLEELASAGLELPQKIIEWRQVTKLITTYTEALPQYLDENNRVHTHYALAATTTGRLASFEPNLQNIPIRTQEGRQIRAAFIAKPDYCLLSADYSQIELRLLAHIADVEALKRAFEEGIDIHALTASEMFHVPLKEMSSEVRRRAKAINFGIIYGISSFGLAQQLGIGREEAGRYIKTYFEKFPGIRDYMEEMKKTARQNGYIKTIFGRKIYYPDINSKNAQIRAFNERAAINAPLQGSAADIIRLAMIKVQSFLEQHNKKYKEKPSQMLLQVHDELVIEAEREQQEMLSSSIKKIMEEANLPSVPLKPRLIVDIKKGKNWHEK